MNNSKVVHF
jgi:GTP-binding protein LepA